MARIALDFGSQTTDQPAYEFFVPSPVVPPNLLDNGFDRENLSTVDHQGVEQPELEVGQSLL